MDRATLRARLEKSVEGIDKMIDSVMMQAMADHVDPYELRTTQGNPVLAPLIVSQTSALLMLANMPEG